MTTRLTCRVSAGSHRRQYGEKKRKVVTRNWVSLFLAVLGMSFLLGCGGDTTTDLETLSGTMPPVLKNLVVTFAAHSPDDKSAGDFQFSDGEEKVFLEFGATVIGPDGPKQLPTFEYLVRDNITVLVPMDGIVDRVELNSDRDDYFIWFKPTATSSWRVEVDHVSNVTVSPGETVTAGSPLGNPGVWNGVPGMGRVELMILFEEGTTEEFVCPFNVFDTALEMEFREKIAQHMMDWETFKGEANLYDEAAMSAPGCLFETMPAG